jgi:RNA polymerase-binding transcription factor DksA
MLNREDLEKAENKLLELKKELENDLANIPDVINFGDQADQEEEEADESVSADIQLGIKEVLKRRLEDAKSALIKIKEGTYGICEISGEEIEKEILEIDPESRHCRKHKALQ